MTLSECHTDNKRLIVGYTTREHLVLDLDNTSLSKIISLVCELIYNYPDVGKCQIMQSSIEHGSSFTRVNKRGIPKHHFPKESYHLVFDNVIGYERCMTIINVLVDLDILDHQYRKIRSFRGDMTIRVSPMVLSDAVKDAPVPIMQILNIYNNKSDEKIRQYHRLRHSVEKLFSSV
jgi:hypothetical protein